MFKGKIILVTGGSGSIGSNLVKRLIEYEPKSIRVLDIDEYGLFNMQNEIKDERVRFLLGDIRNTERVRLAVKGANIIFHAAALKHVSICQYNPDEAIETNVIGTLNLIKAAIEEPSVERFIYLSSDKSCNPSSLYGCTKLLGEHLIQWAHQIQQNNKVFTTIRFCNVKESRGNVVEIWKKQMQAGEALTVTDKGMIRYFISMPRIVELIIKASRMAVGGEVFVPRNVLTAKIYDVAVKMSDRIEFLGIRPGEKLVEQLLTDEEKDISQETEDFYIIRQV